MHQKKKKMPQSLTREHAAGCHTLSDVTTDFTTDFTTSLTCEHVGGLHVLSDLPLVGVRGQRVQHILPQHLLRQYVYFCTSKASKLSSTEPSTF